MADFKHTENNIFKSFLQTYHLKQRYRYILPNCFTQHDNEADIFCVRGSGFYDEFEIKISKADFKKDYSKYVKYRNWEDGEYYKYHKLPEKDHPVMKTKHQALLDGHLSNYFFYILKEGIVNIDEIHPDFGVYEVCDKGILRKRRDASLLHRYKISNDRLLNIGYKSNIRLLEKLK